MERLEGRQLLSINPISPDPLDHTFGGGDGVATSPGAGTFRDVLVMADGRLLAVGNNAAGALVARFNPNGSPDTIFGAGGQSMPGIATVLRRVALLPDGRILARGTVLARFLPNGALDRTFGGGDGVAPLPADGDGLSLQPDGKILVNEGFNVARYNPDGSLDTTFATGGRFNFNIPIGNFAHPEIDRPYPRFTPQDVAYQPTSGKIVVGGSAGESDIEDWGAARLNPNGTLDTAFGTEGLDALDSGYYDTGGRIALGADGTIYMAGETEGQVANLVVFGPDGATANYSDGLFVGNARDVAVGPDGRAVLVGDLEVDVGGEDLHSDIAVARFNPTGPAVFSTDVLHRSDDFGFGVGVAGDGDVVVAGAADGAPVLLRYDSPNVPQVRQAWAAGTEWTTSFRNYLDRREGLTENPEYGLALFNRAYPGNAPPIYADVTLPFVNLNQVTFEFDRPVSVGRDDLRVRGVNVPAYAISDFRYDSVPDRATWTLASPIGADRVLFELNPAKFGDGASLRLNVLPGDVDRSGTVLAADASAVKRSFFRSADRITSDVDAYTIFRDVDGSGVILADDFSDVKQRFFSTLPDGQPGTQRASTAHSRGATKSLFSPNRILA